jgi:thymidylate kinase
MAIDGDPALGAVTAERFDWALGRALRWSEAAAAISDGRWEWLLSRRRAIAWELLWRAPLRTACDWLGGHAARLTRPLVAPFRRPGFFVALLGPDGAGKSTVAQALADDPLIRARVVYMGFKRGDGWDSRGQRGHQPGFRSADHEGRSGALRGGIAYGRRLLAQTRRSLVALTWGLRGRFVVFDRHPHELLIADPARGHGPRLRRWLLCRTCLRPDVSVLLDAPPELLHSRKNEHPMERAAKQRERYRSLAQAVRDLVLVDSSGSEEESVRRVTSLIWTRYRQRLERGVVAIPGAERRHA